MLAILRWMIKNFTCWSRGRQIFLTFEFVFSSFLMCPESADKASIIPIVLSILLTQIQLNHQYFAFSVWHLARLTGAISSLTIRHFLREHLSLKKQQKDWKKTRVAIESPLEFFSPSRCSTKWLFLESFGGKTNAQDEVCHAAQG